MTTNLERIRQMTADELAEIIKHPCRSCAYYIGDCRTKDCTKGIINWLEQESEE